MPSLSPAAIQALISQNPQQLAQAYQNMATSLSLYPKTSPSVTSSASLIPEAEKEIVVEAAQDEIAKRYNYNPVSAPAGASADAKLNAKTSQEMMQRYVDLINDTTAANNAWAAEQAQKQMDFQKMMSDTAHQREIADLKAAGLNPVLSAGARSGAAAASGAMAQPDTSNTRLLAEMSLQAVDSLGSNAVQLANGYSSKESNNFKNQLLNAASKYFVPTLVRAAGSAAGRAMFGWI